jgi:hypothetical protein
MLRRTLGCAAVVFGAGSTLAAQAPARPVVGDRVELVTRDGRRLVGTVAALGPDSIRLRHGPVLLATEAAAFRASAGRDRWRGARRGAVAGVLTGAALVAFALHTDANASDVMIPSTVLAVPAALVLTGVGAGIGAGVTRERWTAPTPLRVGAASPPRGLGVRLGLSGRF